MNYTYADVSKMLDHSLLNPTLTQTQLEEGCRLAIAYDAASICIMPFYLKRCAELVKGTTVQPSTTLGFPHGGHTTAIKLAEAKQALADGGTELDMVVNISQVLSGNFDYVKQEIRQLTEITHQGGAKIKVIFENCYLNDEQKIRLCEICSEVGADWVKTSTGYGTSGATTEDLLLMRKHSAPQVQVKAAGGVRDLERLLEVRAMGVTRCGATKTKEMMDEARRRLGLEPIHAKAAAVAGY